MTQQKYDIVVIGAGPAGYSSAIRAAQLGFKTACIEKDRIGGICLNWGCIPTKALLQSATVLRQTKNAANLGIKVDGISYDFGRIIGNSRNVADRLSKGVEFLFNKNKVTSVFGRAELLGSGKVQVAVRDQSKQEIEASHIIIATGARPRVIPGIQFENEKIVTSKEAMTLKIVPKSMAIIGAGAIGVEFAYFYAALGTKITLIEMMPHILPLEDKEVTDVLTASFKKMGMEILTGSKVTDMIKNTSEVNITLDTHAGEKHVNCDIALVAIGVQGNVEGIGLENLGIKTDKSFIVVDKKNYMTNVNSVFAIGDVIGAPWLAHVAFAEAIAVVENIAGRNPAPVNYDYIPGCTYCQPQIASLGFTEEQAAAAGYQVKVGRFPFRANGKSLAMGHSEGFAKLIFNAANGEFLGAHIIGAEATELLAELGVAKTLGATARQIFETIHAHPTVSEVIKEAAENAYGLSIHI